MLLEHNIHFLKQGQHIIEQMDDALYTKPSIGGIGGGIGPHIRHCVEHYESLLDGIETGEVDYDHRKRDRKVETERAFAVQRIAELLSRLELLHGLSLNTPLRIKMDTHSETEQHDLWTQSSLGRELQSVISHTVHHYALISLLMRHHGQEPPHDFGVAPSTLRFELSRQD